MKYYYIKDLSLYAKDEGLCRKYILKNGEWVIDNDNIVSDRLMGYDPYEEDDSPYKIGNTSIMDELEEISKEEFMKRTQNELPFSPTS